jgi:hypothetical protein
MIEHIYSVTGRRITPDPPQVERVVEAVVWSELTEWDRRRSRAAWRMALQPEDPDSGTKTARHGKKRRSKPD